MVEPRYYEEDDPPRHDFYSSKPDLLRGWTEAGAGLKHILADAEARAPLHPETSLGTHSRFGDVRLHTQYRQTYADPHEKARITRAATAILDACVNATGDEMTKRFEEAMAAQRREDERVFVAAILGSTLDLVYWNSAYGYTVNSTWRLNTPERRLFNADLGRRRLAAPELARHRYGALVTDGSRTNPR